MSVHRNCFNTNRNCIECGDRTCEQYRLEAKIGEYSFLKFKRTKEDEEESSKRIIESNTYLALLSYIP